MNRDMYIKACERLGSPAEASRLKVVSGVKCLHVNSEAFLRDFPQASITGSRSPSEIAEWFESNFSVVSESQINGGTAFCDASLYTRRLGPDVIGLRQSSMGRTCAVEIDVFGQNVIFEIKGCGVHDEIVPTDHPQSNGLQNITAASREYFAAMAIQETIEIKNVKMGWRTATIYAIMLYPFRCYYRNSILYCSLIVREPTPRSRGDLWPVTGSRGYRVAIEIEMSLREMGLTSVMSSPFSLARGVATDAHSLGIKTIYHNNSKVNDEVERFLWSIGTSTCFEALIINIQTHTDEASDVDVLVDLEHIKIADKIPKVPLMIPAGDKRFGFGGKVDVNQLPIPQDMLAPVKAFQSFFALCRPDPLCKDLFWCERMEPKQEIFQLWNSIFAIISKKGMNAPKVAELVELFADCANQVRNRRVE